MRKFVRGTKRLSILLAAALLLVTLCTGTVPAADKQPIVFADLGWDSVQVHNRVAGFIIEHGLGYPIKFTPG